MFSSLINSRAAGHFVDEELAHKGPVKSWHIFISVYAVDDIKVGVCSITQITASLTANVGAFHQDILPIFH